MEVTTFRRGKLTTDAGYGSEQNYQHLEDKGIMAYVKHPQFDRSQNQTI